MQSRKEQITRWTGRMLMVLCLAAGLAACNGSVAPTSAASEDAGLLDIELARPGQVPAALLNRLLADQRLAGLLRVGPDETVANLVGSELELNADGYAEIVVAGRGPLCDASGNCATWLFSSRRDGYMLLLDAGRTWKLSAVSKATNGYSDVVTEKRVSVSEHGETLLQYDRRVYKPVRCSQVSYRETDARGESRELKEPKITVVDCNRP